MQSGFVNVYDENSDKISDFEIVIDYFFWFCEEIHQDLIIYRYIILEFENCDKKLYFIM